MELVGFGPEDRFTAAGGGGLEEGGRAVGLLEPCSFGLGL